LESGKMSATLKEQMLFSFYGDDFTGSTDAMEALVSSGVPTALFLEPPTPEQVAEFRLLSGLGGEDKRLRAFGVPGVSRTLSPEAMREHLPSIFSEIAKIPSRFFHYKICSTFDSDPEIGNFGVAVDLAMEAFPSDCVPLVVAAPSLGRYCAFGNLFARVGEEVFRLDRHPTMSRHPITPMGESDLRAHLASLTERAVVHYDLHAVERFHGDAIDESERPRAGEYVLFDAVDEGHLLSLGKWIVDKTSQRNQLLVGSSGVEYAVCGYMSDAGVLEPLRAYPTVETVEQIIAMAGSAAPGTSQQIGWALQCGFTDLRIDTVRLIDPSKRSGEIARCVEAASEALSEGKSPMLYAARGPDDSAIRATRTRHSELALTESVGSIIAQAQGELLRKLLDSVGKHRVVVAGGDTSGFAAKALEIEALEMLHPIAPGAPLCLAHSSVSSIHGLEISLKGGQNGNHRYFESVLRGTPLS